MMIQVFTTKQMTYKIYEKNISMFMIYITMFSPGNLPMFIHQFFIL